MKLQRLFMLGCMVLAIGLIASCSGEDGTNGTNGADGADGATGPAGAAGADGADGVDGADGIACWDLNGNGVGEFEEDINGDEFIDALDCQGTDGADGADGNANVRRLIIDTSEFGQGTNPVIIDSAFSSLLAELTQEVLDTHAIFAYAYDGGNNEYIPIPGSYAPNMLSERRYGIVYVPEGITITEYAGFGWTTNFNEIHLILIEQSSSESDVNEGMNFKAQVTLSLKAQGLDTSNYHEMLRYFNIK